MLQDAQAVHPIEALYREHLARRSLPSLHLLEPRTRRVTEEHVARAVAEHLACALPTAEALDYIVAHLRAPLLSVAAGTGFWAHCLDEIHGIETHATDLYAPEQNPRFHRPGWCPVEPLDVLDALRRYPDHDVLGVCLPPGLSLQQMYEATPRAASRQLFVAGYFSRDAFGGGREGIMSAAHRLRFRRVNCIARWGLERPDYETVLIHTWRE
jgi:hypothetical protein